MKLPIVSIITPVFNIIQSNRFDMFIECIESVHQQSYKSIEHIVVDGGSTDGTIEILEKYKKLNYIKYISGKDSGIYDAINKGIKLSEGEYIICLNSDDFFNNSNGVEISLNKIIEGNFDFSYSPVLAIDPNDADKKELLIPDIKKIFYSIVPCHQSMIVKKSIMEELGYFDIHYKCCADYDLNLKMCLSGKKCVYLDLPYVTYRFGGYSLEAYKNGTLRKELVQIYTKNYSRFYNFTETDAEKLIGNLFKNSIKNIPQELSKHLIDYPEYFDQKKYIDSSRIKFSIITINFNDVHGLKKTIDSVKNQTFRDFEFIVIDASSTDGSKELLESEKINITKYISEKDSGRYDGMNKGIKMSSGQYLIFMNSGDFFIDEDVLSKCDEEIRDQTVAFGDIMVDYGDGRPLFQVGYANHKINRDFFTQYALPHQATFFHSSIFEKVGLYDDSLKIYGDLELFLKIVNAQIVISHIPVIVANYNLNGISSDPKILLERNQEKAKIFDRMYGFPSINFFTIVLNGMPFLEYHIEVFKRLPFKWHWHIVEGAAKLVKDTAWSVATGGKLEETFIKNNLSIDGTTEYLDKLKREFPNNVTIYRKENQEKWEGKLEMIQAPMKNILENCILWEIDSDEIWTLDQIYKMRELYMLYPEKTASKHLCYFFVGKDLILQNYKMYANSLENDWIRSWNFRVGDVWLAHEPPTLARKQPDGSYVDLIKLNPLSPIQTESANLVFQHYAYATEQQITFKEKYYGLKDLIKHWKNLQNEKIFPVYLKNYFMWVNDKSLVTKASSIGIEPIYKYEEHSKKWIPKYDFTILTDLIYQFKFLLTNDVSVQLEKTKQELSKAENTLNPIIVERDMLRTEIYKISNSKRWILTNTVFNKLSRITNIYRKIKGKLK